MYVICYRRMDGNEMYYNGYGGWEYDVSYAKKFDYESDAERSLDAAKRNSGSNEVYIKYYY